MVPHRAILKLAEAGYINSPAIAPFRLGGISWRVRMASLLKDLDALIAYLASRPQPVQAPRDARLIVITPAI